MESEQFVSVYPTTWVLLLYHDRLAAFVSAFFATETRTGLDGVAILLEPVDGALGVLDFENPVNLADVIADGFGVLVVDDDLFLHPT